MEDVQLGIKSPNSHRSRVSHGSSSNGISNISVSSQESDVSTQPIVFSKYNWAGLENRREDVDLEVALPVAAKNTASYSRGQFSPISSQDQLPKDQVYLWKFNLMLAFFHIRFCGYSVSVHM